MNSEAAVRNLSLLRLAVGVSAWLFPRLAGRLFGLDTVGNPQAPYLARLFGARDVALAVGTLSSTGAAQAQWLRLGVGCDVADTVAGVAAGRAGYLPPVSAVLVTGTAVVAAAQGAVALAGVES